MPFFLPLLGIGAGVAAGTAGLSREVDGVRDFLQQTAADAAKTEEFDRTAAPGQRVERRGLEGLSDMFFGRDQKDIEAAALKQSNKAINTQYGGELATLTDQLKAMNRQDLMPELKDNETSQQFGARIKGVQDRIGVLNLMSDAGIPTAGRENLSTQQLRKILADEDPSGTKKTLERQEANQNLLFRRQDIMAENARRENAAQRAYNEQENRANRAHQTQLAMFDRQDKMADRRYMRERDAAKDRQASIMMLIKGLSQMGAGFAL